MKTEKKALRMVLAQIDFIVGDIENNADKIIETARNALEKEQADVVIFPELALSGYSPEDILLRKDFNEQISLAMEKIIANTKEIHVIFGYPELTEGKMYNSALTVYDGKIIANYRKQLLPNYGVFDEKRYFEEGIEPCLINVNGYNIAITICEDVWHKEPLAKACAKGADIAISINGSPFDMYKQLVREKILTERTTECQIPIVYLNTVGGQDDLVFDGNSFVMNRFGKVVRRLEAFVEKIVVLDFDVESNPVMKSGGVEGYGSTEKRVYDSLVLSVRDYVNKNGFEEVLVAVSGGIDSALVLAIAVDALGADKVHAMFLPSLYSSKMSEECSLVLVKNLGVSTETISIMPIFKKLLKIFKKSWRKLDKGPAEENLQARIRGTMVMAESNKKDWLVLATSNKSELAVGYATLYGDMVGGFSPLRDVFKSLVYGLAEYRNEMAGFDLIPRSILDRAPTAELKADQKDIDTLPPYATLDPILERYLERDESFVEIVEAGFDEGLVRHIIGMVNRNEYKRRQSAIGPKVSARAFGKDRRYPITSAFKF